MVQFRQPFDARQIDPSDAFAPIPEDDYIASIVKSENKATKAGDGSYLSLQWKIQDGPARGRIVFQQLNLDNPNATAVAIAERHLSQICHATGVLTPSDSQELHDIPVKIRVKLTPNKDPRYEPSNTIAKIMPLVDSTSAALAAQRAAKPATQPNEYQRERTQTGKAVAAHAAPDPWETEDCADADDVDPNAGYYDEHGNPIEGPYDEYSDETPAPEPAPTPAPRKRRAAAAPEPTSAPATTRRMPTAAPTPAPTPAPRQAPRLAPNTAAPAPMPAAPVPRPAARPAPASAPRAPRQAAPAPAADDLPEWAQ
jgi:hypothetical protein